MPAEGNSRTGCIVAAALGVLALGALVVAAAGALLFFLSARPSPSGPYSTVAPKIDEPPIDEPPGRSDPDLRIEQRVVHYDVVGNTASELRRQLNALGPGDAGEKHDANTRWHVRWSYPYDRSTTSCGLGKVTVNVSVTYTLPRWSGSSAASPELVTRWNAYLVALQRHEDGHRDNGVAAGRDVLARLRGFARRDTCDAVNDAANDASNRILDEYRDKDRRFDQTTRHGATQGATFP